MLGKRDITLKLSKKGNAEVNADEPIDDRPIEDKVRGVLRVAGEFGIKVFGCVCIYVILDTHRQVAVAKASK